MRGQLPRLCALALIMTAPAPLLGEGLALHKGINTEIWQSWPQVADMLASPDILTPYPEWRRSLGAQDLAHLRAIGFDFLRVPFDPAPLLALGAGAAQDALIAQIRDTAVLVQDAGLTVIIDLHSFPRETGGFGIDDILNTPSMWQDYLALTAKVAAKVADLPAGRTVFEPINEPTLDCDAIANGAAQRWPAMLADLHKAARMAAPDLPLILSGACWGGAWALTALPADHPAVTDTNTILSFHDYGPFLYTHQGATWTSGVERGMAGLPYPPSSLSDAQARALTKAASQAAAALPLSPALSADEITAALDDYRKNGTAQAAGDMVRAAAWADANNIPRNRLILGEFGAILPEGMDATAQGRAQFLQDKIRAAQRFGIAWAVWNLDASGGFGLASAGATLPTITCHALGLICPDQP